MSDDGGAIINRRGKVVVALRCASARLRIRSGGQIIAEHDLTPGEQEPPPPVTTLRRPQKVDRK